ncbi:TPA: hypothetical protein NJT40_001653 [Corynebacterium striatum]|nr:hypothetical protein [Corynebacterium striatum]
MVSPLVQSLALTVYLHGKTRSFYAGNLIDEVKIKWGRESIYAAPAKRSMTAIIKTDTLAAAKEVFSDFLRARVSVNLGSETYYVGYIDTVTPEKVNGTWFFTLTSVEATGWNGALAKTFQTRAANSKLLKLSVTAQSSIKPNVEFDSSWQKIAYRAPDNFVDMTVKTAWEILAAPFPLSFPSWSPEYDIVRPTVWELSSPWTEYAFPAKTIEGDVPALDAMEQFGSFRLYNGGVYGDTKEMGHFAFYSVGSSNSAHTGEIKNPFAVTKYDTKVTHQFTETVRAQITAPRSFRIRDRLLLESGAFDLRKVKNLFLPYETRSRYSVAGDPISELWPASKFVTIGGTITFTHDESVHDMIAAYAAPFTSP